MKRSTKTPAPEGSTALVGQPVDAIDTPALVIDLDAMRRDLLRMAEFARKHNVRWRPHAKMHKSAVLAKLQLQAGAVGVCVQKTAEAQALATGGIRDIYQPHFEQALFVKTQVISVRPEHTVCDAGHKTA